MVKSNPLSINHERPFYTYFLLLLHLLLIILTSSTARPQSFDVKGYQMQRQHISLNRTEERMVSRSIAAQLCSVATRNSTVAVSGKDNDKGISPIR